MIIGLVRSGFLFIQYDLAVLIIFLGLSRYDGGAEYGKTMQLVTPIAYPASQSRSITKHGASGHVLV